MSQIWDTSKEAPNLKAVARNNVGRTPNESKTKGDFNRWQIIIKEALPLQDLVFESAIQVLIKRQYLNQVSTSLGKVIIHTSSNFLKFHKYLH